MLRGPPVIQVNASDYHHHHLSYGRPNLVHAVPSRYQAVPGGTLQVTGVPAH